MNTEDVKLVSNDANNIGTFMLGAMHIVECDKSMLGTEKKAFVLQTIKQMLGNEVYHRYEPLLDIIIDLLVSISRKDIQLLLNKTKTCFKSFGSCK